MPISGPYVSQQIQNAYRAGQQALHAARAEAALDGKTIENLAREREQTLSGLAKHYLPTLSEDAVTQLWQDVRQGLQVIYRRWQENVGQLSEEVARYESEYEEAESLAKVSAKALDDALENQQKISEKVSQILVNDEEFKTLTARAAEAEAALERAEASLEELEHESLEKLPAYEKSKLFMYLYRRGLATPSYSAKGFTRRMDRWVGRLIDYPKAKQGYDFLKQTPEKVRSLIGKDRQSLDVVMQELENRRDTVADQLGLPSAVAAVQKADQQHATQLYRIEELLEKLGHSRQGLTAIEDPNGPYYEQAIEHLKKTLGSLKEQTLAERARRTPDPNDDRFVEELTHFEEQRREVNTEAMARQQRIAWLDRFLADVGQMHQRFRAAGYDRHNSEFEEAMNLESELQLVREGQDTIDNVWMRIRQRQRFAVSSSSSSGIDLGSIVRHPMTQVLVHAMAHAATEAMLGHAKNAGRRYSQSRRTSDKSGDSSTFRFPTSFPTQVPRSPQPPSSSGGGTGGFRTTRRT